MKNNNKVYTFEEIKKDIIKNKDLEYNIIYLRDKYCLLKNNDKFYYIQEEYFGGLSVCLYNKIDYNTKRQADYSKELCNFNDLLNYISKTKNKKFNNLSGTYNQVIFYQLSTLENGKTLEQHLKDISGYREKHIFKNIDRIEEEETSENYNILKFIDTEDNYFKINTKDRERLIIG